MIHKSRWEKRLDVAMTLFVAAFSGWFLGYILCQVTWK